MENIQPIFPQRCAVQGQEAMDRSCDKGNFESVEGKKPSP